MPGMILCTTGSGVMVYVVLTRRSILFSIPTLGPSLAFGLYHNSRDIGAASEVYSTPGEAPADQAALPSSSVTFFVIQVATLTIFPQELCIRFLLECRQCFFHFLVQNWANFMKRSTSKTN